MSVRTSRRQRADWMDGCSYGKMHGAFGRDERNNHGKRLLKFVKDNKLALTNTFFSTRKGGVSHTFNRVSRNDKNRIDYILTRQAHRSRVYDANVHPQPPPPAKAD